MHDSQITNMAWGTSVDNLKRSLTSRSIYHTVVSKLDLRQGGFLVSLAVNTSTLKHIVQSAIDCLCLTICLQMKSTTKLQLCAKFIPEITRKLTDELHISVKNDSFWNTVQTHQFSKEYIHNWSSIFSLLTSNKMLHLRKPIYHHQYRVSICPCARQS